MATLDEISDTLRQQVQDIQSKSSLISKMKGAQKSQAITKCQKQLKRTRNLLKTYQFTIQDSAGQSGIDSHKSQQKQFVNRLNQVQKALEYSRNEGVSEEQLFKHRKVDKEKKGNQRQQLIQLGDKTQEQGLDALKRIRKNVNVMDEQADAVNLELDRQINQLDKIYDDLKDTDTTLKRAQKHLKYFARQVYTDRLMMCLIVLIILAIIVIIILSIIGKTPNATVDALK